MAASSGRRSANTRQITFRLLMAVQFQRLREWLRRYLRLTKTASVILRWATLSAITTLAKAFWSSNVKPCRKKKVLARKTSLRTRQRIFQSALTNAGFRWKQTQLNAPNSLNRTLLRQKKKPLKTGTISRNGALLTRNMRRQVSMKMVNLPAIKSSGKKPSGIPALAI